MSARWFRFYCNFLDQPAPLAIRNEFGLHGEAALIRIMAKVVAVYNDTEDSDAEDAVRPMPELTLTVREWQKMTEFSPKKLQKFLGICENFDFFLIKKSEKTICISIPILLKLFGKIQRGNTKNSKFSTRKNQQNVDTDKQQIEREERKRQNNTEGTLSPSQEREVRKVLRGRDIDPDSPRGERCLMHAAHNGKTNPAGYLVNTLRNAPHFGIDTESIIPPERHHGPQHISECLKQMVITNRTGVIE